MNRIFIVLSILLAVGAGMFVYAARQRERAMAQAQTAALAMAMATASADAKFAPKLNVPDFALTDQNDKPITNKDLAGRVWIADFVFTHCAGPCPAMTSRLNEVAKKLAATDVKFVSFSVDPKRDTPAVLKAYAKQFEIDESRWSFVTGTVEQMHAVARGMGIVSQEESDQSITHSTRFLLVNREGKVCALYGMSDADLVTRLAADAGELSKAQPAK